ncbi:uncharacterized protein LOC116339964 [Contarinia nasturtii]|uniref:uncharacterized protein LOC116339964 n=1 Tax=Contarinia nasturtii TaxID=265458 RepID=UPI0012D40E92|nr:uncharacterized protein LOC116339964 [Contarinia nasturtii]
MSQEQNANESGPSAKKMKPNDEDNNPAAVNGEQQLADIFKLNIDCFEEVFDYLSLGDLANLGQTCKRMQRIAGHCFQLNYGAAQIKFSGVFSFLGGFKIDCFKDFFQNVFLIRDVENHMMNFVSALKHSASIKRIEIGYFRLRMALITEMKEILSKAESVTINGYDENGNELDTLIAACSPNVKYLSLSEKPKKHEWMYRFYPALTRFDWEEIPELETFLELNTTINQLTVNTKIFWSNRELFKNSNIKFDTLSIGYDGKVEIQLFCRLLNELYEMGFYKKLKFFDKLSTHQEIIDALATVKGLVKFRAALDNYGVTVGALRNLEELCVFESHSITDLKLIPHMLSNLKRLHFITADSDYILPIVRHAERVNKIKVKYFRCGSHFDGNNKILDLLALNKEREKLVGARKITIYVEENVYLATKWAIKHIGVTNK